MKKADQTYVIAEAGVNHSGSLDMALQLVEAAARVGADVVKFQTFNASQMISRSAQKAAYQKETTGSGESQLDMVRKLELPREHHQVLLDHCHKQGIEFLSTPFDIGSARFLVHELGLQRIKLGSGDLTNAPLLLELARLDKPIILSTGMSTLTEVETALSILAFGYLQGRQPDEAAFRDAYASKEGQTALYDRVSLLHCTTEYPAPFDQINLRAMDTLGTAFGLPVGFSDHSKGIAVPIAAVARGASIIEKHFTLDRELPGPDHRASLQVDEFASMVTAIRQVESALGSSRKLPGDIEIANRTVARKSLVALCDIRCGEEFTENNLGCKRPGDGLAPLFYWDMLGRKACRDFSEDEAIER